MEMFKASILYLLSIVAARALRMMTPIEFDDKECQSTYTTRTVKGDITYVITVNQWVMLSKTRLRIFNTRKRYYVSEILVLYKDDVILTKTGFFPEPTIGLLSRTKLPHAIVAMAALNKVRLASEKMVQAA